MMTEPTAVAGLIPFSSNSSAMCDDAREVSIESLQQRIAFIDACSSFSVPDNFWGRSGKLVQVCFVSWMLKFGSAVSCYPDFDRVFASDQFWISQSPVLQRNYLWVRDSYENLIDGISFYALDEVGRDVHKRPLLFRRTFMPTRTQLYGFHHLYFIFSYVATSAREATRSATTF